MTAFGTRTAPKRGAKGSKKKKPAKKGAGPQPSVAGKQAVPPMSGLAVAPKIIAPTAVETEGPETEAEEATTSAPEVVASGPEAESGEVEAEDEGPVELTEEERLANVATLTAEDKLKLLTAWKIAPNDTRQKFIFQTQASYIYFSNLSDEARLFVNGQGIKKQRPMSPEDIVKAKADKARVEQEAAEKLAQEQAAEQARQAHDAKKKTFADNRAELKKRIAARLVAEKLDDFIWADDFEKQADAKASIIEKNPTADVKKQTNALDKEFTSRIDKEKKTREVTELAKNKAYDKLNRDTLAKIKDAVINDASLAATEFDTRCVQALRDQRNPTDPKTWIKWLKLQMYPAMETLSDQDGFKMHFSLDEESLTMPGIITDTTTAVQLVDQIMRAPSGLKLKEAHVSLESGVRSSDGKYKNPHLYWRGPGRYELNYSDQGSAGNRRWDENLIDQAGVVKALDAAMAEIKARITADAQKVLDKAGDL